MSLRIAALLAVLGTGASCAPVGGFEMAAPHDFAGVPAVEASAVEPVVHPKMRWDHRPNAAVWTAATRQALRDHGRSLVDSVPRDIDEWCPAYRGAPAHQRELFWTGLFSALSKHESTYDAKAVGGGGLYHGLVQISPKSARWHECEATSGEALRHGPSNLRCAVRMLAQTSSRLNGAAKGVAAMARDWGPMHSGKKRADMKAWVREQAYCRA